MLKQILFLVTIVLVLLAGCASEKQSSTDVAPTDKANILPDPSTKMDDRTWRLAQGDINWLLFKETPDQTWQLITPVLHGNNEARYLLPGTAQRYILAYGREAPLFSLPHDLIHIDYIGPSANREPTQLEKFQNDFLHDLHAIHTIRGQLISDVETGLRWLSIAGQELRPYDYDDYEIKVAPGLHDIIAFESAKDNPRFFIKRNVNIQQDEIHNIDFTDAEFVFSAQVFSINNNCNSLGDGLKSIYGRFQSEYGLLDYSGVHGGDYIYVPEQNAIASTDQFSFTVKCSHLWNLFSKSEWIVISLASLSESDELTFDFNNTPSSPDFAVSKDRIHSIEFENTAAEHALESWVFRLWEPMNASARINYWTYTIFKDWNDLNEIKFEHFMREGKELFRLDFSVGRALDVEARLVTTRGNNSNHFYSSFKDKSLVFE